MSSPSKPLLAFFGATGGSTLAALIPSLNASYTCLALIRSPQKLTSLLLSHGVSTSTISTYLHITTGNVLNVSDVAASLTLHGKCADIIFSGIGVFAFGARQEIRICRDGVSNIISALGGMKLEEKEEKPLLVALSTTGIARGQKKRDLPLLMTPLYKWGLHAPHEDKIAMEDLIVEEAGKGEGSVIRGFVIPRPSMLPDGTAKRLQSVRVGTEEEPAVGYTISRADVGAWLFERLIKGDEGEWVGKKPTLTY